MGAGSMNRRRRISRLVVHGVLTACHRALRPPGKVFLLVVCWLGAVAQAQSATEYQVKAAFLFNFARFVEWPTDAFPSADSALKICVLGQDPFGRDFEQVIEDKTVNGHRLEVAHPDGVPQARACQILFVASSEKQKVRDILRNLAGISVLTVGDPAGLARLGG